MSHRSQMTSDTPASGVVAPPALGKLSLDTVALCRRRASSKLLVRPCFEDCWQGDRI
uniref:hypothetical protein n=1 Tax=Hassallia byssoidea TaxID=482630 RepID=UPI001F1D8201|nr:hypothetical protein [Hassalia byssoidea]